MIQHIPFQTGGFVLHKVTVNGCQGHFSAWFGKDGNLTDAEQRLNNNQTRPVLMRHNNVRAALQTIGNRYKK